MSKLEIIRSLVGPKQRNVPGQPLTPFLIHSPEAWLSQQRKSKGGETGDHRGFGPTTPSSPRYTQPHPITPDHTRSHPITPDHTRSHPITHDHARSHTITHDHTQPIHFQEAPSSRASTPMFPPTPHPSGPLSQLSQELLVTFGTSRNHFRRFKGVLGPSRTFSDLSVLSELDASELSELSDSSSTSESEASRCRKHPIVVPCCQERIEKRSRGGTGRPPFCL